MWSDSSDLAPLLNRSSSERRTSARHGSICILLHLIFRNGSTLQSSTEKIRPPDIPHATCFKSCDWSKYMRLHFQRAEVSGIQARTPPVSLVIIGNISFNVSVNNHDLWYHWNRASYHIKLTTGSGLPVSIILFEYDFKPTPTFGTPALRRFVSKALDIPEWSRTFLNQKV